MLTDNGIPTTGLGTEEANRKRTLRKSDILQLCISLLLQSICIDTVYTLLYNNRPML